MEDQRDHEAREVKRRKADKLNEYVRVYWPLIVAMFFAISTWAEYRTKVIDVSTKVDAIESAQKAISVQGQANATEIAVLKSNVDTIKNNTERIINRLDRMKHN